MEADLAVAFVEVLAFDVFLADDFDEALEAGFETDLDADSLEDFLTGAAFFVDFLDAVLAEDFFAVVCLVADDATCAALPFTISDWPGKISAFLSPFARMITAVVVWYFLAMPLIVSPDFTTCVVVLAVLP